MRQTIFDVLFVLLRLTLEVLVVFLALFARRRMVNLYDLAGVG
jgi:hypothetical protein